MASSKITLIGLYNYDPTIFDNLIFPAGIDKDIAVDEILMRSGEFEIIYPNPDFLRVAITHWGRKHFRTFDKWIQALALQFDPLYNYDRYEEYTDERTGAHTQSHTDNTKAEVSSSDVESMTGARSTEGTSSDVETRENSSTSGTSEHKEGTQAEVESKTGTGSNTTSDTKTANSVSGTTSESITDDTKTRSVSAYDAATFQDREQEVGRNESEGGGNGVAASTERGTTSGSTSDTGNTSKTGYTGEDVTGSGSESGSESSVKNGYTSEDSSETSNASRSGVTGSESESAGNLVGNSEETTTHTAHLYGNIGVTTSTQMLEDFLRVERFNIYEQIADIFIDEFCILVY